MNTIRSECERAAGIVTRLLSFARSGASESVRERLDVMLQPARELMAPVLEARGTRLLPAPDRLPLRPVEASASSLHQVLVNLLLNAAHAAGDGGEVSLEFFDDPDQWPGFRVRDNGPGVPKDMLPQLFDPFFTTKEAGEGTGLGLSVCYGIVRDHGGTIEIRNHPDGGAVAEVRLPPAGEESA